MLQVVVPCKVTDQGGMIVPGDLLVSSDKPGRAMKASQMPQPGTVIGKALLRQREHEDNIDIMMMLR